MSTPLALLILACAPLGLWIIDNEFRAERAEARRAARLAALVAPRAVTRSGTDPVTRR